MANAGLAADAVVEARDAGDLPRAAGAAARAVATGSTPGPGVLLVFAGHGGVSHDAITEDLRGAMARAAQRVVPTATVVVLVGDTVLGGHAVYGAGPTVTVLALSAAVGAWAAAVRGADPPEALADTVAAAASAPVGDRPATLSLVFLGPSARSAGVLEGLARVSRPVVAGAGVSGVTLARSGQAPTAVDGVVLTLAMPARATVVTATAARVITPWQPITARVGPFVTHVGDVRLLDLLEKAMEGRGGGASAHDPVFVAVKPPSDDLPPLLRAIVGVDVPRGGVAVSDYLPEGTQVALALRDLDTASQAFSTRLTSLARSLAGAVPAGALLFSGLGRGRALAGEPAAVQRCLPGIPLAGMHVPFELAPWGTSARLHVLSAVLVLLYRPS